MEHELKNVVDIGIGKWDAVRTLRETLREAEEGKIKAVVIVCVDGLDEEDFEDDEGQDIWATWSQMHRRDVLWLVRWLNSFVNHRYFGKYHDPD